MTVSLSPRLTVPDSATLGTLDIASISRGFEADIGPLKHNFHQKFLGHRRIRRFTYYLTPPPYSAGTEKIYLLTPPSNSHRGLPKLRKNETQGRRANFFCCNFVVYTKKLHPIPDGCNSVVWVRHDCYAYRLPSNQPKHRELPKKSTLPPTTWSA